MPTLSMNINVFAPTQYGNFQFEDICEFRGRAICSNQNGTYLFGEDNNDNGNSILSEIELLTTDFGRANLKHPRFLVIGAKLNDNLNISIKVDGDRVYDYFLICDKQIGIWHNHKVPIKRECDGRYFTITIKNSGGNFTIDSIDAMVTQRHKGNSF